MLAAIGKNRRGLLEGTSDSSKADEAGLRKQPAHHSDGIAKVDFN